MKSKTCWANRVKPTRPMNLINLFRESVGPITKSDKSVSLLNPLSHIIWKICYLLKSVIYCVDIIIL